MFLVGCTPEGEQVDVVDEQGNIVGEAFRMPAKNMPKSNTNYAIQVSENALNYAKCQDQVTNCGFVNEEDLTNKVKEIIVENMKDSFSTTKVQVNSKSCEDACVEKGKQCISAFNVWIGDGGSVSTAKIATAHPCSGFRASSSVALICQCI